MDWLSGLTGKKDQQASSYGSYGAPSSSFGSSNSYGAPSSSFGSSNSYGAPSSSYGSSNSFGAPAAPASSSWWGGRRHKRHRQRGGVGNNVSANNNANSNSNANSANAQKLIQQQMVQKGGFAHPYTMSNGVDRYATPIEGIRTASHMKQSGGRRSRRVKGTRKKHRRGNKRTRKH